MARNLHCTLCNSKMHEQIISFIHNNKLLTMTVLVCVNEICLKKRGGISIEHREEKRKR